MRVSAAVAVWKTRGFPPAAVRFPQGYRQFHSPVRWKFVIRAWRAKVVWRSRRRFLGARKPARTRAPPRLLRPAPEPAGRAEPAVRCPFVLARLPSQRVWHASPVAVKKRQDRQDGQDRQWPPGVATFAATFRRGDVQAAILQGRNRGYETACRLFDWLSDELLLCGSCAYRDACVWIRSCLD